MSAFWMSGLTPGQPVTCWEMSLLCTPVLFRVIQCIPWFQLTFPG
jgi:hypothetical protein